MQTISGLLKALLMLTLLAAGGAAYGQTARTIGDKDPTVRLCPTTCQAVNGHGLKAGSKANVYETRDGWARVSDFLSRRRLIRNFGRRNVPRRPALWVPVSSLVSENAEAQAVEAPKPTAKPKKEARKPRRVNVVERVARLRRPPVPTFRADGSSTQAATTPQAEQAPAQVAEAKPAETVEVKAPEPVVEETPKTALEETPEPVTEKPKVVVIPPPAPEQPPEQPKAVETAGQGTTGAGKTLTWEELQAKIAAQKAQIQAGTKPSPDTAASKQVEADKEAEAARLAEEKEAARVAAENAKKVEEARKAAELEEARIAAQKAAAEADKRAEAARLAEEKEAARVAAENAKKAEEARKAAEAEEARIAAQKAAAEEEKRKAAAAAAEEEKRKAEIEAAEKRAAEAREKALKAEQERARKAAEAAQKEEARLAALADEQTAAAAEAAKPPKATKDENGVGYTPPKEAAEEAQVALGVDGKKVVLPPTSPSSSESAGAVAAKDEAKPDETQVAAIAAPKKPAPPEPVFESANADPISFGARPKKMTKALLDKRLRKLPGTKSRAPKEVVIALRHYALGLLNSGECKGIDRGGNSTTPGMLFVACSEDPNYLRQFPLQEESW